jgi:hypothetical protein
MNKLVQSIGGMILIGENQNKHIMLLWDYVEKYVICCGGVPTYFNFGCYL